MNTAVAAPPDRMLELDPAQFREKLNRKYFTFEHHLSDHPLFELPRLVELAAATARNRPQDLYFDAGSDVSIGQRWNQTGRSPFPVDETIRRIEHAGAWIILKKAENDPDYAKLLKSCMSDLLQVSGRDLERQMKLQEAIIFVTSPNRITTYHIDRECNFLLQIHGEKEINLFDHNDSENLPEHEKERFWTIDNNSAIYKPQFQYRADVYNLTPGSGVHIPINAPHWLQNGNNISVSLNVNFQYHERLLGDVYRANYFLRKMGIRPTPPRVSPWKDSVKASVIGSMRAIKDAVPYTFGEKVRNGVHKNS